MTQKPTNRLGLSLPNINRRRFLGAFAGVAASPAILIVSQDARAGVTQTADEVNAWTKRGKGYIPRNGFIPDRTTATRVAEVLLAAVYGERQIAHERPFNVALVDSGVWLIWGALPKNSVGGTAVIKLSKRTGQVLYLAHGQ